MKKVVISALLSIAVVSAATASQQLYFCFEQLPFGMWGAKEFFKEDAYPKRVVPSMPKNDPAYDLAAASFSYDSPRWLYYVSANNPQFYLLDVIQNNKNYYIAMVSAHRDAVLQELTSLDEGTISQEYVSWLRDKLCRSGMNAFFAVLLGTAAYETYFSDAANHAVRTMVAEFAGALGLMAAIKTVRYWMEMANYRQNLLDWYQRDMDLLATLEQM
ncbi:MAG TPA: hypothetical protein VEK38_01945 [Candidatus Bathyarchaeia archaeon]|nr:hypothetical protein [Candidatus Bathyarchaeia archaeon]